MKNRKYVVFFVDDSSLMITYEYMAENLVDLCNRLPLEWLYLPEFKIIDCVTGNWWNKSTLTKVLSIQWLASEMVRYSMDFPN